MLKLNDAACRGAKPSDKIQRLSDGSGLYLEVLPSGKKTFRMQYRLEGKQLTLTLGAYPEMGLAAARGAALDARLAVKAGRDPKGKAPAPDAKDTFKAVATEWYEANAPAWKPSHSSRVWHRLERDLFPVIGDKGVATMTAPQVLEALRRIEDRGAVDTARRVRQHISGVFTYAIATGRCDQNPAFGLTAAMKKPPRGKHYAALAAEDVPDFFAKLARSQMVETSNLCIRLVMHTAVRTNELAGARWKDVQGDRWIIPGERMKMEQDHVVPLTKQSKAILRRLKELSTDDHVAHLKPDTLGKALRKVVGTDVATIHGMRSLFSTLANDSGLWNPDAVERQLAHAPRNRVRAAYNRALHIEERARLMLWWSDWLDQREKEGRLLS